MPQAQGQIDQLNADFWDELCGTHLAKHLGVTDDSPQSLERFDRYFLDLYPYLGDYLPEKGSGSQRLLEIGLGYGTVSQILAGSGFDYNGLDIAAGPVGMVRHRLRLLGVGDADERVRVGSVLEAPHPAESFDQVVTIGCLHHTGDIAGAVREVHRVLRPGGRALVMVYKRSRRRELRAARQELLARLRGGGGSVEEAIRGGYDRNSQGEAAPATEYTSVRGAADLFGAFSSVDVRRENMDEPLHLSRLGLRRQHLLGWPARLAGLDLYVTAIK